MIFTDHLQLGIQLCRHLVRAEILNGLTTKKTTRKNRVFYYNPSIATNTTPCKQYLKSIITPNLNFSVLISHCFAVSLFLNRYAISTFWRHLASAIRRFLTASQFRYFSIATRLRHFWRHLASAIRRFLTASQFRYFE